MRGAPMLSMRDGFFVAMEHPYSVNGRLQDRPEVAICAMAGLPHIEVDAWSFNYTTVLGSFACVLIR